MASDAAESPDGTEPDVFVRFEAARDRTERAAASVTRVCFGGRAGLTVFVASLAFLVLTWRVGTFFNDIEVFPRVLGRMAAGELSLGTVYEVTDIEPGMYQADGKVYGRNYGQAALALPLLWLLEAVDPVVDLRWLVVVGWSGLLAATGYLVGEQTGFRRRGLAIGVVVGLAALAANAQYYKPFVFDLEVIALQFSTMLIAACTGVLVYRLLARMHGERIGLLAGAATVLATPVGFWAIAPKRHALSAMLVVLAVYAFARSRETPQPWRRQTGFRALAYASSGFLAWVHGPEGFTLFLAVAVVDLPTAPRNDPRTLAVVAGVFALSLLPFFLTNALISGNPFMPPRFLDTFGSTVAPPDPQPAPDPAPGGGSDGGATPAPGGGSNGGGAGGAGGGGSGGSTGSGSSGGGAGGWIPSIPTEWFAVGAHLAPVIPLLERGISMYTDGVQVLVDEPERVVDVFFRWGEGDRNPRNIFFDGETNISMLESAPIVAGLAALPVASRVRGLRDEVDRLRDGTGRLRDLADPNPVDLLVVVFSLLLVALFIHRLPIHAQATVRYLHPLYPLLVYGVARQPRVRRVLTGHTRPALLAYEATTLLGTPVALWSLLHYDVSKGGFVQTYGLVALGVAAVLAVALLVGSRDERADPVAAVAFGVAAGLVTVYLLMVAFAIMHFGPSALPFFEMASGEYRYLTLTS
jgi:uncharacterized membrane protein YgcG